MITPLGRTMGENWQSILDEKCAFTLLPD